MAATLESRFPMIIAELIPKVSAAIKESAEVIAEDAGQKVPDRSPLGAGLIAAIHVEREGTAEYSVIAGDDDAFYGHIVEHGSRYAAPQPFLIPAMEEKKPIAEALVTAALRSL
jgi:HK97 gp10 family phage protein